MDLNNGANNESKRITVIKPKAGLSLTDLTELWRYRELFYILAARDIKVRYKQTVFGSLWAIAQPLLTMAIFSFFFGKLAQIPSEGIPYPIFSYSGLLLWMFFNNAVNIASSSLLNDARLISKVYFPRLILPIATTFVSIVDYFVAGSILILMMFFYKVTFHPMILLVPIILFFTWMLSAGLSLFFSALYIRYRDIKYVIPFFFQLLIFMTPVIYPISGRFKWLLQLNPMSGLIEAHRVLILGNYPIDWRILLISIVFTIIIFISGLLYFKRVERYFADII